MAKLELTLKHYFFIAIGLVITILDFIFLFSFDPGSFGPSKWYFAPILVLAFVALGFPFVSDILAENRRQKQIEIKFLEFVRGLVETVRSGVSIPQAILHVKSSGAKFGPLSPYIDKLANQIEWGYPLHDALNIFAKDTKNPVIKRSVGIVIQAEKSGGDLAAVLEAVSGSVLEIKKLRDEQRSQAYGQTIQGYIIFFVFILIMIVMQVYLIPKLGEIGGEVAQGLSTTLGGSSITADKADLTTVFYLTIVIQGLFAGLMIGKFADGTYISGIKHAIIMVVGGYLLLVTISGLVLSGSSAPLSAASVSLFLLMKREWLVKDE